MMGTLTMAAKDHVMMKTVDGKDVTVALNGKTKILRGRTAVPAEELKEGMRVVVTVTGHKPPYTASQIALGTAAETTGKK